MKSNPMSFDISKSSARIEEILKESDNSFQESKTIPVESKLTYKNGFYVNIGAMFVDIRNSSTLTDEHYRPKLAKLYRAYISEITAVFNSNNDCKIINIIGDCISAIFEGQNQSQIKSMIDTAAKINSVMKVLNYQFKKNNIIEIKVGIGISWGRALIVKAGYNGSGINDLIWMGDVANVASNLCNRASKDTIKPVLVSDVIYNNLDETNKKNFQRLDSKTYQCNILDSELEAWYQVNCVPILPIAAVFGYQAYINSILKDKNGR